MRVADAVATELEQRILDGALRPGARLTSERELAIELAVSRPSLRESIQKLVSRGLLVTRHGGGTYVTDRLEAPFVDPRQEMLSGHPNLQSDLLECRHMLESQAAFFAAERATDADLECLAAAERKLDPAYASKDLVACVATDVKFHLAVADAAHNVLIGHLNASLLRLIQNHITTNIEHLHLHSDRWEALQDQHHEIARAIRQRRPDDAAAAAKRHIDFMRQSMEDSARERERRHLALLRLGET